MKKLKSILSIALTGVLIFSTLGFSVSRHYCMGALVEESFYHLSERCGILDDNHCKDSSAHLKKDCCEDENLILSGIEILSTSKDPFETGLQPLAVLQPSTIFIEPQILRPDLQTNIDFPPDISPSGRQILIVVQRFLI